MTPESADGPVGGNNVTSDTEAIPTAASTVAEITQWLDAHGIDHTGKSLKADLLALVPAESGGKN